MNTHNIEKCIHLINSNSKLFSRVMEYYSCEQYKMESDLLYFAREAEKELKQIKEYVPREKELPDDYEHEECYCHLGHPPCDWCIENLGDE